MEKELSLEEKWEQSGLENGFIFYKVFRTYPDACKKLLEILLHIEIEKIEILEEETILTERDSKGIRLDLYIKNDTHIFDVEMQIKDTKEIPERARYYQSIMDVDSLKVKQHFKELKTSHVIFICMTDIFDKGLPVYTFQNSCNEDSSLKLNDRTFKHFFMPKNYAKIKQDDELKAFLELLQTKSATNDYTKDLKSYVDFAKKNTQWRHTFMEWERQRVYDRDEGIEIGQRQTKLETAVNFIKMNYPLEQIALGTGLALEEVQKLKETTQ